VDTLEPLIRAARNTVAACRRRFHRLVQHSEGTMRATNDRTSRQVLVSAVIAIGMRLRLRGGIACMPGLVISARDARRYHPRCPLLSTREDT